MNKIHILGRIARDPELKEVNGASVVNFTVAADTRQKGPDGKYIPNWYSVSAWRGAADTISRYMHKGDQIMIVGDLFTRNYKTATGEDRMQMCVNLSDFEFVSSKQGQQTQQTAAVDYSTRQPAPAPAAPRQNTYAPDMFGDPPF